VKITFLGTNGWYDTKTGNTTCILIETNKDYIILDAGNGLHKANKFIKSQKPVYLFLSHFHLDHIVGLHILNKFDFPGGLTIFGQPGTKETLNKIISKPFTIPLEELPFSVEIQEIEQGHHESPFSFQCHYLSHSVPTLGFRFHLDHKTITYCPDTGYCEAAVKLAQDADLLISECSFRSGETSEDWPHLSPETAAQIAREANAKRLALVHFDPARYRTLSERNRAKKAAQRIFPDVIATMDEMQIKL
jgi:ribonuclease BN (tRNA processing enzyme)